MNTVSVVAEKTWQHMNSHNFWVEPHVSIVTICRRVASDNGIRLTPKQLRYTAKEVEKRLL